MKDLIFVISGIILGVSLSIAFLKVKTSVKDQKVILRLQIENSLYRIDRVAVKARLVRAERNIEFLLENDQYREGQILTCLEWLGEITRIRNSKDLASLIGSTDRFRAANKLKDEDTYISK